MMRYVHLCLGGACYLMCLATMVHVARFLFQTRIPSKTAEHGYEVLVNVALVLWFCISHTVLASEPVKRFWKREVSITFLQRSTYIVVTCLSLELLVSFWRPFPVYLWNLDPSWHRVMAVVASLGWILILLQTVTIDPFELLGLKQIWYHVEGLGDPLSAKSEGARKLYEHLRHPMLVGLCVVLFVSPVMSADRLSLGFALVCYLLLGNSIDKQDIHYVEQQIWGSMEKLVGSRPI